MQIQVVGIWIAMEADAFSEVLARSYPGALLLVFSQEEVSLWFRYYEGKSRQVLVSCTADIEQALAEGEG
jgi:hypothetical protein